MKRSIPLLLVILTLLLSACASNKPVDKMALLRAELAKWQNFSADGVVRATHAGLTLHKLFVLNKTSDSARFDVVDGGAFGISPTPLVSVYLADYLAVESTLFPQLQSLAQAIPDPSGYLALLAEPEALIEKYGAALTASDSVDIDSLRVSFSGAMKLKSIRDLRSGAEVSVAYTSSGDPDVVMVSISKNTAVELLVDNISYGKAETVPLPRNEAAPASNGLLDLLEGLTGQP